MTRSLRIAVGLVMLLGSASSASSQQQLANLNNTSTLEIAFSVHVSVDDKPALPDNSKIEWKGTGEGCANEQGTQSLHAAGTTHLSLRACKVRLLIFITGYDTRQVVADLTDPGRHQGDVMSIALRNGGDAVVTWRKVQSPAPENTPSPGNDATGVFHPCRMLEAEASVIEVV